MQRDEIVSDVSNIRDPAVQIGQDSDDRSCCRFDFSKYRAFPASSAIVAQGLHLAGEANH